MSDTCIVNFAKGGWYSRGQSRLVSSFMQRGYKGDFLLYEDESDLDCPLHINVPYAFKPYALMYAVDAGYRYVIWADSSIWPCNNLQKMWDQIDKDGYMLVLNGWTTGEWCSDAALPLLGITREESFELPHLMANVMGFDFSREFCREFLEQYYHHANIGTFCGPWDNKDNKASSDPKVLGHRHDQTAASVIAWRLGMRNWLENWVSYDVKVPDDEIFMFKTGPA